MFILEYLVICIVTLFISILTLLSGFGLGTVLVPVFALFFPLTIAIAATAIVHLMTSIFQAGLVGKYANWKIVLKFGIPAVLAALIGAYFLSVFSNLKPIFYFNLINWNFNITLIGLIVGTMIIFSSLFELVPQLKKFSVPAKYIPIGGLLSGFFGGVSGYQGTLRSAFLIKSGLNKEEFIGTSALCSIMVDISRIVVYGFSAYQGQFGNLQNISTLLIAASLSAFLGSYVGSKLMHKMTFKSVHFLVGCMLFALGFAIVFGIGRK